MADTNIAPEQRQHYTQQFLHFLDEELDELAQADAISDLQRALAPFSSELPAPPYGLPGANADPKREVMEAMDLAHSYFVAVVAMQPRRQWNAYKDLATLLQRTYQAGIAAEQERYMQLTIERAEAAAAAAALAPPIVDGALVYFIGAGDGPIKIGMSDDPRKRLRTLQTSHHQPLAILAVCEGGRVREGEYHRTFARHRLNGEWFARHPDILAEIASLTGASVHG
jgi:hypothetical protein